MLRMAEGTLVTLDPHSIGPMATIDELRETLEKLQIRHLPVVDAARRVVGVVSDHDVALACYQRSRGKGATAGRLSGALRVEEIMSRQVVTLEQFGSPETALRAMVANGFHSMPVVADGELVGMITSTDFLREFSYGDWGGYEDVVSEHMRDPGQTVEGEQPLSRAFETAETCNQSFVVVVRGGRPLGVLSRTALRETLCDMSQPEGADVAELAAMPTERLLAPLSALNAQAQMGQAASKMLQIRARALPVVDRSRALIGLMTEDDILRVMAQRIEL